MARRHASRVLQPSRQVSCPQHSSIPTTGRARQRCQPGKHSDKLNEFATAAILANLPPRYKHLVRDDTLSASELWGILKAKLCVVSSSSEDTARSNWLSCIQTASQTVDVHFDNYLRVVDYMSSMQIEESGESLLSRLLHSIDKTRFGT